MPDAGCQMPARPWAKCDAGKDYRAVRELLAVNFSVYQTSTSFLYNNPISQIAFDLLLIGNQFLFFYPIFQNKIYGNRYQSTEITDASNQELAGTLLPHLYQATLRRTTRIWLDLTELSP